MELQNTLLTLCGPGKGHGSSSVLVEYHEDYNFKPHPSLQDSIELEWNKKLKENVHLFNASKFRLHRIDVQKKEDENLNLHIGLTCYKDFIGTNCAPYAEKLALDGMKFYHNSQAYMSDPIGVGSLLVTNDNFLVLIRRSQKCAEMPGLIDRPGGHPEPDEVSKQTELTIDLVDSSEIVSEIFASVLKEIRDEVNIPLKDLCPPILLGIGFNPHSWNRPSMEFYTRCCLSSKEIESLYKEQTQAESEESTEIFLIPLIDILENELESLKIYDELTHPAKCALYFLKVFQS